MTMHCSDKDWLLLSRYLSGALTHRQAAALDERLSSEPELEEALKQLDRTRTLLAALPGKKIPHNFMIKAGESPRRQSPRYFPVARIATVVTCLLFAALVGLRISPLPTTGIPVLMIEMPVESQESIAMDSVIPPAAPKTAPLVEDEAITAIPVTRTAVGAGVAAGPSPIQQEPEGEVILQTTAILEKEEVPWGIITWGIGLISLALVATTVYFYFQERV
jgi:anti-sigma factor RsiW